MYWRSPNAEVYLKELVNFQMIPDNSLRFGTSALGLNHFIWCQYIVHSHVMFLNLWKQLLVLESALNSTNTWYQNVYSRGSQQTFVVRMCTTEMASKHLLVRMCTTELVNKHLLVRMCTAEVVNKHVWFRMYDLCDKDSRSLDSSMIT